MCFRKLNEDAALFCCLAELRVPKISLNNGSTKLAGKNKKKQKKKQKHLKLKHVVLFLIYNYWLLEAQKYFEFHSFTLAILIF